MLMQDAEPSEPSWMSSGVGIPQGWADRLTTRETCVSALRRALALAGLTKFEPTEMERLLVPDRPELNEGESSTEL